MDPKRRISLVIIAALAILLGLVSLWSIISNRLPWEQISWGDYQELYEHRIYEKTGLLESEFKIKFYTKQIYDVDGEKSADILVYNPFKVLPNFNTTLELKDTNLSLSVNDPYKILTIRKGLRGGYKLILEENKDFLQPEDYLWALFEDMRDDMGETYFPSKTIYEESMEKFLKSLPTPDSSVNLTGDIAINILAARELSKSEWLTEDQQSTLNTYIDNLDQNLDIGKSDLSCFAAENLGEKKITPEIAKNDVKPVSVERLQSFLNSFYNENGNSPFLDVELIRLVDKLYFCEPQEFSVYEKDLEYILGLAEKHKNISSNSLLLIRIVLNKMNNLNKGNLPINIVDMYLSDEQISSTSSSAFYLNCLVQECSADSIFLSMQTNLKKEGENFRFYGTSNVPPSWIILSLLKN